MIKNNIFHIPVLSNETISYLNPQIGGIYVDCTLGGGGHTALIAQKIGNKGKIIAIDQDPEAIAYAKSRLKQYQNIIYINDNFSNLSNILNNLSIEKVDGILFDLGVSSYQLENPKRGFSFNEGSHNINAPLDMRMNPKNHLTAYAVINTYPEYQLRDIFFRLGQEPYSRQIAHKIVATRQENAIITTNDLLQIIKSATPPKYRFSRIQGHYASKIFRAIRMEVNQELESLTYAITQAIARLNPQGHLVVITFHSLEDKFIKHYFRDICTQEPEQYRSLTKKAIIPTDKEIATNPRAHSAKLRAIEQL